MEKLREHESVKNAITYSLTGMIADCILIKNYLVVAEEDRFALASEIDCLDRAKSLLQEVVRGLRGADGQKITIHPE